jgi:hypothetical protein
MKIIKLILLSLTAFLCSTAFAQHDPPSLRDSSSFDNTLHTFVKGKNLRRYHYVKKFARRDSLHNLTVRTEGIDWMGLYRNVIVEKKGTSDSIVYFVCHYDKIDGNLFAFINMYINGSFDILLSNLWFTRGAYDNGTGVLSLLSLMQWADRQPLHYTYRFLFTGMEEYGLRGSRRHVSAVKTEEWNKVVCAVNLDMVAGRGVPGISVSQNVSDERLVSAAESVCKGMNFRLIKSLIPSGALSDYYFFQGQSVGKDMLFSLMANFSGMFIPQRSYFTKKKKPVPVINFSDPIEMTIAEVLGLFSPVSFGEIHSFHDRMSVVDPNTLVKYHYFFQEFIKKIDSQEVIR